MTIDLYTRVELAVVLLKGRRAELVVLGMGQRARKIVVGGLHD